MGEYNNKLSGMTNNADDQIDQIDDSTSQIETQIEELEAQRDAIQYGLMDQISFTDLSSYLVITKIPEKAPGGGYLETFGDYGNLNVTEWRIYAYGVPTVPPAPPAADILVYEYEGTGWDNDSTIIDFINKWNFGYDYIHHTFDTTGTYGLQAKIDQLYSALNLLQANRDKIENSKTVFSDYKS